MDVTAEQPHRSETSGRVLLFRPRASMRPPENRYPARPLADDRSAIADLAKYEHLDETDDFRHRMITNAIAFIVIAMLTTAGIWLAETISVIRKNQDCLLSGRQNCAPIDVHARNR
jgi:hypothetical protein